MPTRPRDSPTLPVQFIIDRPAYSQLQVPIPRLSQGQHPGRSGPRDSVADSGAELTVLPHTVLAAMSIKEDSIFPVMTRVNGANSSLILVNCAILITVTATNPKTGESRKSRQLTYISHLVQKPYLSFACVVDLGLLPVNFPEVGACD